MAIRGRRCDKAARLAAAFDCGSDGGTWRQFECPPPGAGLTTVTIAVPSRGCPSPGSSRQAGSEKRRAVARAAPFQFTVEVLTKLAPLTVSVRA